ncbi:MAG: hypothetical protein ABI142_10810, partial [Bryocella sp.]
TSAALLTALLLLPSLRASAQSLPPNAPTALPSPSAQVVPIAATPAHEASQEAEVTYAAGLLNVRANDSSLNQILSDIAHLTGMKITGGVPDTRIFGNYGPADVPTILATLLSGTGSNLLLRQSTTTGEPQELVITRRNGGATPPSPSAAYRPPPPPLLPQRIAPRPPIRNDFPDNGPAAVGPRPMPQPANNVLGSSTNRDPTASTLPTTNSVPISTLPTPSTATPPRGIVDAPNPPPPGSTTSPNPNGISTPEQIYEQLKLIQQKNAQQKSAQPAK